MKSKLTDEVKPMKEKVDISLHPKKTYMYIIVGADKVRMMTINDNDVILNADGGSECPLESILRKNSITLDDLQKWKIESIKLVEMTNEDERVLYDFEPNHIAKLLQA